MDIRVEVEKLGIEELRAQVKAMQENLKSQIFSALTLLEAQILQNIRSASGLQVRTSKLLNSIGRSKKIRQESSGVLVGEIGPRGVPYAAIHEFGGTILPKKAGTLAIPSPYNVRKDGTPKMTTDEARASGRSFVKNGVVWIKEFKTGRGKSNKGIKPLFFLQKSVTIPQRPYLAPAVSQKRDEIMKNFGLFLVASFPKKD